MHELSRSITASRRPTLFIAMAVYYVGMTVNCMLTPSPYSALHSGKLGPEVEIASQDFFVSPAYILLGAEAFTVLIIMNERKPQPSQACIILVFSLLMIISGIVTGAIYTNLITYIYNILSILMASLIANHDSVYSDISEADLRRLGWIWGVLSLAGFGLCISMPYRYGILPFEFSRASRGEITYWMVLGLYLLVPVQCGLSLWSRLSGRWLFAALSTFVTVVCLSTVTRCITLITLSPYVGTLALTVIGLRCSLLKRATMTIFLLCGVASVVLAVTGAGLASPEDMTSMESTTNQRIELWQFHWENFLRDPLFGAGPFSLDRNTLTITDSQATSEIGAFIWFSEYGLLAGSIVLFWVIRAFYLSTRVLIARRGSVGIGYLFCVLVFASLIVFFLVEDLSRILDWLGFLFWYSMFYLNAGAVLKSELGVASDVEVMREACVSSQSDRSE